MRGINVNRRTVAVIAIAVWNSYAVVSNIRTIQTQQYNHQVNMYKINTTTAALMRTPFTQNGKEIQEERLDEINKMTEEVEALQENVRNGKQIVKTTKLLKALNKKLEELIRDRA